MKLGFWIPIVSGIQDSLSCIPDSTTKVFPNSRMRIPLHGAILVLAEQAIAVK